MTRLALLTVGAALGSATIGGALYAFSTFVMSALDRLPPSDSITAMQSINITAMGSGVGLVMLGSAALTVPVVVLAWRGQPSLSRTLLLAGGALLLIGGFVVTGAFNVRMNEALAPLDPMAANAPQVWADYLRDWTRWNHVRTAASLGAAACFIVALVSQTGPLART